MYHTTLILSMILNLPREPLYLNTQPLKLIAIISVPFNKFLFD